MSGRSDHEPWWGDEAPVGTDRRPNGVRGDDVPAARGDARERDVPPRRDVAGRGGGDPSVPQAGRSRAQVFIPAPEDLPPLDEFGDPILDGPAAPPSGPRRGVPDPGALAVPAGGVLDPGPPAGPAGGIPNAPLPPAAAEPPPAPVLERPGRPRPQPAAAVRPGAQPIDRRRLATVYDVDGPRVRLGIAWFAGAMVATALSPFTAAIAFAVAAGLAARQVVRAWGSVPWQADLAAGLGSVPVLAALIGAPAAAATVVVALMVAAAAAGARDGARLPGPGGRVAAAGILVMSVVPAVAGATVVLTRANSVVAACVLLLLSSAYEVGDFIVGSGASNPVEGPLAGITTATLVSLPLALVLVEPYDTGGVGLVALTALACPLGQIVASAVLPGAAAHAPALRRIDTLLVLAPIWAAAAGAF